MTDLEKIIKLSEKESKAFSEYVKEQRRSCITVPQKSTSNVYLNNNKELDILLCNHKISQFIYKLRSYCFDAFLIEESRFNQKILSSLGSKFTLPKTAIIELSKNLYNLNHKDLVGFTEDVQKTFGEYIGCITPYLYQLLLSNTQSRRARAGKTFEEIIYFLYEYFKYPFDSQLKIGKQDFTRLGLGKVVDSILPSVTAFEQRRNKTIVGSMKTTLRERWQEVVEELQRSNLPNVHLLTVDDNISTTKLDQMALHNIVLVVLDDVKSLEQCKNRHSVISFEEYFMKEIPTYLNYWSNNV